MDLVDNLTGWVEARTLRKLKVDKIADFLFDVMCRFGCVFQLMCDNGMEFKGATEELMRKYKVPVVHILPYNSQANRKIKRTQRTYLEAIWKVIQGDTGQWPLWLGYELWADRTMVKRNTGYSLYYLLYGQHLLHPFDVIDVTYHTREWVKATDMKELLALRMQQLAQKKDSLDDVEKRNYRLWMKAVDAYNQRHAHRMKNRDYVKGELVLVYDEALENQMSGKGALRWRGPYAIVARRPSGAYVLQELDGAVLKQLVAWKRLKSYVPRQGLEPVILLPKWISRVDEIKEELLRNNTNELQVLMIHANGGRMDIPSLSKPWLLKDEEANEYWQRVYQKWME